MIKSLNSKTSAQNGTKWTIISPLEFGTKTRQYLTTNPGNHGSCQIQIFQAVPMAPIFHN